MAKAKQIKNQSFIEKDKYEYIIDYVGIRIKKYINAKEKYKQPIINNIHKAFSRKKLRYDDYENDRIINIVINLIINNNLCYKIQKEIFPNIDKLICDELNKLDDQNFKYETFNIKMFNAYRRLIINYEYYYAKINYGHFNCVLDHFYKADDDFYKERKKWADVIDNSNFCGYYRHRLHSDNNYNYYRDLYRLNKSIYDNLNNNINNIRNESRKQYNEIGCMSAVTLVILIFFVIAFIVVCSNFYDNHVVKIENTLNLITKNQDNINQYLNSKKDTFYSKLF